MGAEHFDVIIVGAGLSGIGAAVHLQRECPKKTYAILEGRDAIGGTWDLFRYPGIRSDSDMYTLGYNFKPWTNAKAIADGPSIREYVRETAAENGVNKNIRFHHQVRRATWSSEDARWTVEAETAGRTVRFTCNFIFMCSGYYDYAGGYTPDFEGAKDFKGTVIHPQHWPEDLDYSGKRVVVIGSGATAMTLVPEMAKHAGHVVMLQRSPTYVVSRPAEDKFANWLRRNLPPMLAYGITRWQHVLLQQFFYRLSRKRPEKMKKFLLGEVKKELGPDYDVEKHFTPKYNPWDQRVCLVPDSDLFHAIKSGKASVVTDQIVRFTPKGVLLASGKELEADIIVTATGLKLQLFGGMQVAVDGAPVNMAKKLTYKGMMYDDIPNLMSFFGYTNASWTLKCDLTCEYACRLLNYMDTHGYSQCVPRRNDSSLEESPWLDLASGYIQRSAASLPKQGSKAPWKLYQNYARDMMSLRYASLDDGTMEFSKASPARQANERPQLRIAS